MSIIEIDGVREGSTPPPAILPATNSVICLSFFSFCFKLAQTANTSVFWLLGILVYFFYGWSSRRYYFHQLLKHVNFV
jgi:hypothetical protein